MGGGDLDGDLFLATWCPDLIPKDLRAPNARPVKPKADASCPFDDTWEETLHRSVAKWITNNDTGRWANEWLKAVEQSSLGADDPCAIARSGLYEVSLDALKAGDKPKPAKESEGICGPKRVGKPMSTELRENIHLNTDQICTVNWSQEKLGKLTEERRKAFQLDPDLLYKNDREEWKEAYMECDAARKRLWADYHILIGRCE